LAWLSSPSELYQYLVSIALLIIFAFYIGQRIRLSYFTPKPDPNAAAANDKLQPANGAYQPGTSTGTGNGNGTGAPAVPYLSRQGSSNGMAGIGSAEMVPMSRMTPVHGRGPASSYTPTSPVNPSAYPTADDVAGVPAISTRSTPGHTFTFEGIAPPMAFLAPAAQGNGNGGTVAAVPVPAAGADDGGAAPARPSGSPLVLDMEAVAAVPAIDLPKSSN
jgi:hypothetical protein